MNYENKESQFEKFNFLEYQIGDRRKKWALFCRILEDRVNVEEQYIKGIEEFLQHLEEFAFEGALASLIKSLKEIDKLRSMIGQNIVTSLRKDIIEEGNQKVVIQNKEREEFSQKKRELTDLLQNHLEGLEKLKSAYISYTRESDLARIEYESLAMQRSVTKEKKIQALEKYEQLNNLLKENECQYLERVTAYNDFVDSLNGQMASFNESLILSEITTTSFLKEALTKVWNNYIDDIKGCQKIADSTITHTLNQVETDKEIKNLLKKYSSVMNFPPKIQQAKVVTFIQEGFREINNEPNIQEENILEEFRKHYNSIILDEKPIQAFNPVNINNNDREELIFLAKFLSNSWQGEKMANNDIAKFQGCLSNKLFKKAFIGALQQYRISGKFKLSEEGFNNLANLLAFILKELMNSKEVNMTTKVLILSFTFWKVAKEDAEEKKYLQSAIVGQPIWKDLDYWVAAIFVSIHEELVKQRSLHLDNSESFQETCEREQNVVFGQLLNFGHNMIAFMISMEETKNIIGQFCKYYNFSKLQIAKVMEFGSKKKEEKKIDFIFDYFGIKGSQKQKNTSILTPANVLQKFPQDNDNIIKIQCEDMEPDKQEIGTFTLKFS